MDRNIRFHFDQPFSRNAIDVYISEYKDGKSYAALPVNLEFVPLDGYERRDPCISIEGADLKKLLGNMRDFLARNGYLSSDEKEIARLEAHIKDLQGVIASQQALLQRASRITAVPQAPSGLGGWHATIKT